LFWGSVPLAGALLLAAGMALASRWLAGAGVGLLALPLVQLLRLTAKGVPARKLSEAFTIAAFQLAAKPAQALGIGRYWLGRLGGKRSALIEYKQTAA